MHRGIGIILSASILISTAYPAWAYWRDVKSTEPGQIVRMSSATSVVSPEIPTAAGVDAGSSEAVESAAVPDRQALWKEKLTGAYTTRTVEYIGGSVGMTLGAIFLMRWVIATVDSNSSSTLNYILCGGCLAAGITLFALANGQTDQIRRLEDYGSQKGYSWRLETRNDGLFVRLRWEY